MDAERAPAAALPDSATLCEDNSGCHPHGGQIPSSSGCDRLGSAPALGSALLPVPDPVGVAESDARTAATTTSQDSRWKGEQARPFHRHTPTDQAFLHACDVCPATIWLCQVRPAFACPDPSRVAALRKRAEIMMLGDGERPVASGMEPAAANATNGLILDLQIGRASCRGRG